MTVLTIDQILSIAMGVVFGGGITAVAASRMRKDVAANNAETQVITLLRAEIDRLHDSNVKFSEGIVALQGENAELRAEMVLLRAEVEHLSEIAKAKRICPSCGGSMEPVL